MRCNNCGAEYKATELKCPYCGADNRIGQEWKDEENAANRQKEQTRKYVIQSMPLYIMNRVLNTILGVGIGLAILAVLVSMIAYFAEEKIDEYSFKKASMEEAEELYQMGKYELLDEYLSDHDVYYQDKNGDYDKYKDIVALNNGWVHLKENMFRYYDSSQEKIEKSMEFGPVERVFEDCREMLYKNTYYFEIDCEENEPIYEEYAEIVKAFLAGEFLFTEEEIEQICNGEVKYSNQLEWVQKIYERKGWKTNEND